MNRTASFPASFVTRYPLVTYFLLAYGITFALSAAVAPVVRSGGTASPAAQIGAAVVMNVFVLAGPALAALIVIALTEGRPGLRAWIGKIRVWRVPVKWWLFIALYPLALRLLVAGIDLLLGGEPVRLFSAGGPGVAPALFGSAVFLFNILRSFSEELGWRGYALPRLQERMRPLAASLLLGSLWALWHFHPINLPALSANPWGEILSVMGTTILFTWVYNHTRGSLLIAILFHTFLNWSEWVVPLDLFHSPGQRSIIHLALLGLIAAAVVLLDPSFRRSPVSDGTER